MTDRCPICNSFIYGEIYQRNHKCPPEYLVCDERVFIDFITLIDSAPFWEVLPVVSVFAKAPDFAAAEYLRVNHSGLYDWTTNPVTILVFTPDGDLLQFTAQAEMVPEFTANELKLP